MMINKKTVLKEDKMKKSYAIEVIELHEVAKTYYIDASSKAEAKKLAKRSQWDDASGDDPLHSINKVIILSTEEN
jgi:hypothetical protein